jgi:ABC-type branched-subunit amino acid transport system ATPase component
MLEIKNISKSFAGNNVIQNFSMKLEKGRIYVLFGTNGAGKTTLLNIVNGQIQHDTGQIVFDNKNISKLSMSERANLGILRLWQQGKVFKNMTVLDNLLVSVDTLGENLINYAFQFHKIRSQNKNNIKRANEVMNILEIESKSNQLAKELSFGQQRLLSFGRIMMNPLLEKGNTLILADEPFAGIHKELIKKISDLLYDFAKKGNTVLMIEHNIDEAIDFADDILLMQEGTLNKQFQKKNLSENHLQEIYNILT